MGVSWLTKIVWGELMENSPFLLPTRWFAFSMLMPASKEARLAASLADWPFWNCSVYVRSSLGTWAPDGLASCSLVPILSSLLFCTLRS